MKTDAHTQGAPRGLGNPKEAAMTGKSMPAMEDETKPSQEEQAQYDQFVINGMRMLYDEKGMKNTVQAIQGDGNPIEGLANTVAMLVMRLEDSAGKSGAEIDGGVMLHAGEELLGLAAELSEKAGGHKFTDDELEAAGNIAMDLYRNARQQQGKLPTDEIQQDMQELLAAEQNGSLEQLLPGISDYAARTQDPSQMMRPPAQGAPAARRGLAG